MKNCSQQNGVSEADELKPMFVFFLTAKSAKKEGKFATEILSA